MKHQIELKPILSLILTLYITAESFQLSYKSSFQLQEKFQSNIEQHEKRILTKLSSATENFETTESSDPTSSLETISRTTSDDILQQYFSFPLDNWQLEAGSEIMNGKNAIVCAPTGAGKTVVGEMALHLAFSSGKDAIYTTPLKALSNQKFMEFRKLFGAGNVGLLTGDMSINKGARITVMTTEVYRNMAWRAANRENSVAIPDARDEEALRHDLSLTSIVVLDEFHYMGQPGRGGVWEECVITSPSHTQIVGLSATLPNGHRLSKWMESATDRSSVLVEAGGKRPVPLRYLFASRDGLHPLFSDPDAGPGSPKGLLGLRGDGEPSNSQYESKWNGIPLGLLLNPKLTTSKEKQIEKVERAIKRKAERLEKEWRKNQSSSAHDYEDDNFNGGKRYRKRARPKKPSRPPKRMTNREINRERERRLKQEMRKAVPSIPFLVSRLDDKGLLPSIFFIFSRVGCDEAADTVCNTMLARSSFIQQTSKLGIDRDNVDLSPNNKKKRKSRERGRNRDDLFQDKDGRNFRAGSDYITEETYASVSDAPTTSDITEYLPDSSEGLFSTLSLELLSETSLLSKEKMQIVASRIILFNKDNVEIAFPDSISVRFLLGVGSHHAGILPAHKAFVETLFREQLLKAVFATETLAAGINMPARTTVICSIAKRGGSGNINLLETSNLLQMAGRAGRRGMDIEGTCVIVATAFEGPNEASQILLNEVEAIKSQFAPSYTLSVNLIARGNGKLDVAKQLVQKSFAVWERHDRERQIHEMKQAQIDGSSDIVGEVWQDQFLTLLKDWMVKELDSLQQSVKKKSPLTYSLMSSLESSILTLSNGNRLKKESKGFVGATKILELELNTLDYLKQEEKELMRDETVLFDSEMENIRDQIKKQTKRVKSSSRAADRNVFNKISDIANQMLTRTTSDIEPIKSALQNARESVADKDEMDEDEHIYVTPKELTIYAKTFTTLGRKRKKESIEVNLASSLLNQLDISNDNEDISFDDMFSLIKVLEAYGCLKAFDTGDEISHNDDMGEEPVEEQRYEITSAGTNVALIGFENALWILTALGGAWDVAYDSAGLDEFRDSLDNIYSTQPDDIFDDEFDLFDDIEPIARSSPGSEEANKKESSSEDSIDTNISPKPQLEAEKLMEDIQSLTHAELAGYISCLIADEPRRGAPTSAETFHKLSRSQQHVVQNTFLSAERLMEVQKIYSVDESIAKCRIELGTCDVVTAWAAGCTWTECLEMSGSAPGDLVRVLHRALDALNQLGNLPYHAIRATDGDGVTIRSVSSGIHPNIRRMCKDAAYAMDRYPVKDALPFEEEEEDIGSDIDDDDEEEEGTDEEDDSFDSDEEAIE